LRRSVFEPRNNFPVAAWLICFTVLNVLVKGLSLTVATGSLFEQASGLLKSPILYLAGILYVTCALLYFLAMNRLPLSTAGPTFMVLGVVTTAILGAAVFGEALGFLKVLGIGLCILGTVLIFYDAGR
jgi:multidrug transporter EmrE-like cation transporter